MNYDFSNVLNEGKKVVAAVKEGINNLPIDQYVKEVNELCKPIVDTFNNKEVINLSIIPVDEDFKLKLPCYATKEAACMDVFSPIDFMISPGQALSVKTGFSMNIPVGYCVKFYSRSGQGFNNRVTLLNSTGIIDSDYTGEIIIGLKNDHVYGSYNVKAGQAIAQFQIEKVIRINYDIQYTSKKTERASNGFGSTDKFN